MTKKKEQIHVVIEKPTIDLWTKSLKQILKDQPGDFAEYEPTAIVTKYYFDYTEDLTQFEDVEEGKPDCYEVHWSSASLPELEKRVKRTFGKNKTNLIEARLVLVCTLK